MPSALPTPENCCTTCGVTVNVLVPGPQGPAGADCTPCTDGTSAATNVNQPGGFVMPVTDASVVVTVVSSLGFAVGQYVFVQNAGYLKIGAKPSSTSLTLINENYPGNAPFASVIADGSQVVPGGIKGLDGGVDFSTITTASFVMPDVNTVFATTFRARAANVATITTAVNHLLTTGDYVKIATVGGADYNTSLAQVTVTGATTFTYANAGGNEGATADTAGRVTPNVQIAVSTSLGFIAGQDVFIQDAGYFYVQEVPDTTHMIVQNNSTPNNEASGVTISSGVRVSISLNLDSLSPTTSKGQILVDNGANSPNANLTAMSPGTNGQVLVADSAQANGRANATITPNTATDNGIPRFDGASGTPVPLQTSGMSIDDLGALQSIGGNARGSGAVDLQVVRTGGTQVASGTYSAVIGGVENTASGIYATTVAGNLNVASGDRSVIVGGQQNVASAADASIFGGASNTASAAGSTILGSSSSIASAASAVVVGGTTNTASAISSAVIAGSANTASGIASTVLGGSNNTASGFVDTVIGGGSSVASGGSSVVIGGSVGTASGGTSTVCGGSNNTASGIGSFIGGGSQNTASGDLSTASGSLSSASLYGESARASGMFASIGDAQKREFIGRISTGNNTPTEMALNGASAYLTLPNDTTWAFEIYIAARRTDVNDESAAYLLQGCIDRNGSAATTALVGSVTKTVIAEDTAAWDVAATADTVNGYLAITVTGEAAKTIRWVASVKIVQVTG